MAADLRFGQKEVAAGIAGVGIRRAIGLEPVGAGGSLLPGAARSVELIGPFSWMPPDSIAERCRVMSPAKEIG